MLYTIKRAVLSRHTMSLDQPLHTHIHNVSYLLCTITFSTGRAIRKRHSCKGRLEGEIEGGVGHSKCYGIVFSA
jgi:hypothetical protein